MANFPADPESTRQFRAMAAGLHGRPVCVLHEDDERRYTFAHNLPSAWPVKDVIGLSVTDVFPDPASRTLGEAAEKCRGTGLDQSLVFVLYDGKRDHHFQARFTRDIEGVVWVIEDVTQSRVRDAAMTALLREVSHRSKNLLAIVQSVAMQTAVNSDTIDDFLDKFRGRLHALSGTQDLVTDSDWRGTYLHRLIAAQINRVGNTVPGRLKVVGENPLLKPNAALHIGLALHELAANAALHGMPSKNEPNQICLEAVFLDRPGRPADLLVSWSETGLKAKQQPQEPRFGTLVLERIVPLSVGGSAEYAVTPDHVSYKLTVPADQFEV